MSQEVIDRSTADADGSPLPPCSAAGRGTQEWRQTHYTERLAAFYDPCSYAECFPRGVGDVPPDQVVLSCQHGGSFHRVAGEHSGNEASEIAADGGARIDSFADCEHVPVQSRTDLAPGDGVVWDGVVQPLVVQEPTSSTADGVVPLKGPDGGDYYLELRSGMADVVFPGYGHVSALRRLRHQEATMCGRAGGD